MPNLFENTAEDGIFPHECEELNCNKIVQYDDEPKCFQHSPDVGSSVRGYSARRKSLEEVADETDDSTPVETTRSDRFTVTIEVTHFGTTNATQREMLRKVCERRCWEVANSLFTDGSFQVRGKKVIHSRLKDADDA